MNYIYSISSISSDDRKILDTIAHRVKLERQIVKVSCLADKHSEWFLLHNNKYHLQRAELMIEILKYYPDTHITINDKKWNPDYKWDNRDISELPDHFKTRPSHEVIWHIAMEDLYTLWISWPNKNDLALTENALSMLEVMRYKNKEFTKSFYLYSLVQDKINDKKRDDIHDWITDRSISHYHLYDALNEIFINPYIDEMKEMDCDNNYIKKLVSSIANELKNK